MKLNVRLIVMLVAINVCFAGKSEAMMPKKRCLFRSSEKPLPSATESLRPLFEMIMFNDMKKPENVALLYNKILDLYGKDIQLLERDFMTQDTLLHHLIRFASCEVPALVKLLVSTNPWMIAAKNENQKTPLHCAVELGQRDTVEYLTRFGSSLFALDWHNNTPLHLAVKGEKFGIVNFFCQYLSSCEASVDIKGAHQRTPLHEAVIAGNIDLIKTLLTYGANINGPDEKGLTPLHLAATYGYVTIVELLIKSGALLDAQDSWGDTPLHWAFFNRDHRTCSCLIERGANQEIVNFENQKPRDRSKVQR